MHVNNRCNERGETNWINRPKIYPVIQEKAIKKKIQITWTSENEHKMSYNRKVPF